MSKIKVAVIGVGSISESHIAGYKKDPNTELYAFCDINPERLQYMGKKHGITRLYTDEAQMLKELPELDAVSVCTWNSAHAPCTIMALNAGKHVLCEKPMALNVEEAEAMKAAAEKNGKLLMIAFVRRFGKDCEIVKDMAESGTLGEVYYAKAINLRSNGNPGGWFGEKARSGGGPLIDLGVHSIDLVRYLLGKPNVASVYGVTFHKLGNRSDIHVKTAEYQRLSQTLNERDDSYFRVKDVNDKLTSNIPFAGDSNSFSVFSSVIDEDNFVVYNLFGYWGNGKNNLKSTGGNAFANSFLGYKYYFYDVAKKTEADGTTYLAPVYEEGEELLEGDTFCVYENTICFPSGYV
ncbi:MAG: Gfo/Idh/MocA family oxidoreductase, partial [Clostridia bacterium]|nr:Gfo/Idh/MocA family oxidoreductase [Clostridia bacterium]